jgi:hypothetical protein
MTDLIPTCFQDLYGSLVLDEVSHHGLCVHVVGLKGECLERMPAWDVGFDAVLKLIIAKRNGADAVQLIADKRGG